MKVVQLCQTLCDPVDYTVHGILQARILEWVAFPFCRDLPNPGTELTSPTLQVDSLLVEPQEKPRNTRVGRQPIPSPAYLPDPGIEPGSLALQVDSLPTDLSERQGLNTSLPGPDKISITDFYDIEMLPRSWDPYLFEFKLVRIFLTSWELDLGKQAELYPFDILEEIRNLFSSFRIRELTRQIATDLISIVHRKVKCLQRK